MITAAIFLASLALVSASGVSVPYWDTPGNENPLYLNPRETKDISLELQNMVGEDQIIFQVSMVSEGNVAQFIDEQREYTLAPRERKKVLIRITAPETAKTGNEYKVTFTAREQKAATAGQFTLGSAFESSFDVIIQKKQSISGNTFLNLSQRTTWYILGILIIIVIIIIWLKRKKQH